MANETTAAPAAEKKTKKAEEKRAFKAVHNIVLEGETHAPGATVEITRAEYDALKPHGSIEGAWDE